MAPDDTPLFGNTCGKLYRDRFMVVARGKNYYKQIETVRNIKFVARPTLKGLFFLFLPAILFLFPFLMHDPGLIVIICVLVPATILAVLSIVKMDKHYSIVVFLKDGTPKSYTIWSGNIVEAKRLVKVIAAALKKRA
ncbi:hypothetical protein AM493_12730 [Flavobacterium akiainvivens]|uniref:Uncharacterized protein n=1 Tax=Flavobacterium akiainvivens TaxID=1202724 RepID=A0A0M8MIA0_9FLAO|nr:hypothetical protein [Flavobacterium akiainvivens]KOS06791.1 hypothetical protein AM493_12730 [Flavobacterium akiainvivens]